MLISADPTPSPAERRSTAVLLAVLFFCSSLFVFSRDNDFPFYFHPDERGKIAQVLDHTRNFHHPLLMLTVASQTTRVVKDYINRKPTYQETVVIGRWIAAVFMAGGVALMSLTLLRTAGLYAALAGGIVLTCDPTLFLVSHYMKEDPTLFFSLSLLFLVFTVFNRRPTPRNLFFFGAAMGLVAASKYTGLIALAVVYPFLIYRLRQNRRETNSGAFSLGRSIGIFTLALLTVFLVFNYPMILEAQSFLAGFGREVTEVTIGQHGVRKTQVPHPAYLQYLFNDYVFWYWPVVAGWLFSVVRLPSRQRMEYLFPTLVVTALLIMISFSPKISERYLLPTEIFILFVMCAASGFLFNWRWKNFPFLGPVLAVILVGLVLRDQWLGKAPGRMGLQVTQASFATNSFQILHDWIELNLPPDAVLLQPEKRFLPDPEIGFFDDVPKNLPQKIYSQSTFVKSGSLVSARALGVTHVVVLSGTTRKYEGPVVSATRTAQEDRTRRSDFFKDLVQNSRLVYQIPHGRNLLLHPGFEIYELNPFVKDKQ